MKRLLIPLLLSQAAYATPKTLQDRAMKTLELSGLYPQNYDWAWTRWEEFLQLHDSILATTWLCTAWTKSPLEYENEWVCSAKDHVRFEFTADAERIVNHQVLDDP